MNTKYLKAFSSSKSQLETVKLRIEDLRLYVN